MNHLMADMRQAFRGFRRSPGFAVVIILTLALGIGANSAIFSIVRGVLLSPLPYDEPDRLMFIWNHFPSTGDAEAGISPAEMADWRDHPEIFEGVAGIATGEQNAIWTITENGEIYNPFFRFMARFVFGYTATMETYLKALGKKFGEDAEFVE